MELHLKFIGLLLTALALIHGIFPKYFDWDNDLKPLSLINKQLMYIHTFFIAFVVLLMGVLCLTSANQLVETDLGKRISLGFGLFWGVRLVIQFFGYSSKLWKGKKLETTIHILFSILWTYLTVVFLGIYWA
jgi:hypothetical protein